jgi:hypothetical protein
LYTCLAVLLTALGQPCIAQQSCEKLKDLQLPKVEIMSATLVQARLFCQLRADRCRYYYRPVGRAL